MLGRENIAFQSVHERAYDKQQDEAGVDVSSFISSCWYGTGCWLWTPISGIAFAIVFVLTLPCPLDR
jgi:hypothetical protein